MASTEQTLSDLLLALREFSQRRIPEEDESPAADALRDLQDALATMPLDVPESDQEVKELRSDVESLRDRVSEIDGRDGGEDQGDPDDMPADDQWIGTLQANANAGDAANVKQTANDAGSFSEILPAYLARNLGPGAAYSGERVLLQHGDHKEPAFQSSHEKLLENLAGQLVAGLYYAHPAATGAKGFAVSNIGTYVAGDNNTAVTFTGGATGTLGSIEGNVAFIWSITGTPQTGTVTLASGHTFTISNTGTTLDDGLALQIAAAAHAWAERAASALSTPTLEVVPNGGAQAKLATGDFGYTTSEGGMKFRAAIAAIAAGAYMTKGGMAVPLDPAGATGCLIATADGIRLQKDATLTIAGNTLGVDTSALSCAQVGDVKMAMVSFVRHTVNGHIWCAMDGSTIGDASSGATWASADAEDLFLHLWNTSNYDPSSDPVVGGKGASAAADWAAHKKLTLPAMDNAGGSPTYYSRFPMCVGGSTTVNPGRTGGSQSHGGTDHGANTGSNTTGITVDAHGTVEVPVFTGATALADTNNHNVNDNGHSHGLNLTSVDHRPPWMAMGFFILAKTP